MCGKDTKNKHIGFSQYSWNLWLYQ